MRVTGDKIHVFKELGEQLQHSVYSLSCDAYTIASASKLFIYAIENLTLKGGGTKVISLQDISSALELLELQADSVASKIADIGEAISKKNIMADLNKYKADDLICTYRGNAHKEDLLDDSVE